MQYTDCSQEKIFVVRKMLCHNLDEALRAKLYTVIGCSRAISHGSGTRFSWCRGASHSAG